MYTSQQVPGLFQPPRCKKQSNNSYGKNEHLNRKVLTKSKKYTSAYGIFFREFHTKLKAKHPSITFGEMSRQVSFKWRNLNKLQKSFYNDKVSKTPYTTNYGLFFHDHYKQIKRSAPYVTFGKVSSTIANMWDGLTTKQKRSYKTKLAKQPPPLCQLELSNPYEINRIDGECNNNNVSNNQITENFKFLTDFIQNAALILFPNR